MSNSRMWFNGWNLPEDINDKKKSQLCAHWDRSFSTNMLTQKKTTSVTFPWLGFDLETSLLPTSRHTPGINNISHNSFTMGTVSFRKSKRSSDFIEQDMIDFQFRLILVNLTNESQSIVSKATLGSVPSDLNVGTEISFCIPSLWTQNVYDQSRGFVDSNGLVVIRVEMERLSLSSPKEMPFISFPSYITEEESTQRECPENKQAMAKHLQSAKEMKVRGNLLIRAGDHSAALAMFTRGIDILTAESQLCGHIAVAELWALSSQAHLSLDEFSQALKTAEKCRLLRPTWPASFHRLVLAHLALNHSTTAMDLVGKGFGALEETKSRLSPQEVQEYTLLFAQLKEDALECIQANMFTPQLPAVKKTQRVLIAPLSDDIVDNTPTSPIVTCETVTSVVEIESTQPADNTVHDQTDFKKRKLHLKSKKRQAEKRKDVVHAEPKSQEQQETVSVCTTNESHSVSTDNAETAPSTSEESPVSVSPLTTPPASPQQQTRTSQLKAFLRIPSRSEDNDHKTSQEVRSPTACWDNLSAGGGEDNGREEEEEEEQSSVHSMSSVSCSFCDEHEHDEEEDEVNEVEQSAAREVVVEGTPPTCASSASAHYNWFIEQARSICQQPRVERLTVDSFNCSVLNFYHNLHVVGAMAAEARRQQAYTQWLHNSQQYQQQQQQVM